MAIARGISLNTLNLHVGYGFLDDSLDVVVVVRFGLDYGLDDVVAFVHYHNRGDGNPVEVNDRDGQCVPGHLLEPGVAGVVKRTSFAVTGFSSHSEEHVGVGSRLGGEGEEF